MYFLLTASVLSPVQVFDFCAWCKVGTSFLSFSHFDNISMKLATLSQDCRTAGSGGGQVRSAPGPSAGSGGGGARRRISEAPASLGA